MQSGSASPRDREPQPETGTARCAPSRGTPSCRPACRCGSCPSRRTASPARRTATTGKEQARPTARPLPTPNMSRRFWPRGRADGDGRPESVATGAGRTYAATAWTTLRSGWSPLPSRIPGFRNCSVSRRTGTRLPRHGGAAGRGRPVRRCRPAWCSPAGTRLSRCWRAAWTALPPSRQSGAGAWKRYARSSPRYWTGRRTRATPGGGRVRRSSTR